MTANALNRLNRIFTGLAAGEHTQKIGQPEFLVGYRNSVAHKAGLTKDNTFMRACHNLPEAMELIRTSFDPNYPYSMHTGYMCNLLVSANSDDEVFRIRFSNLDASSLVSAEKRLAPNLSDHYLAAKLEMRSQADSLLGRFLGRLNKPSEISGPSARALLDFYTPQKN